MTNRIKWAGNSTKQTATIDNCELTASADVVAGDPDSVAKRYIYTVVDNGQIIGASYGATMEEAKAAAEGVAMA